MRLVIRLACHCRIALLQFCNRVPLAGNKCLMGCPGNLDSKINPPCKNPTASHIDNDLNRGIHLNGSRQFPHFFATCHHTGHPKSRAIAKENIRKAFSNHCPEAVAIQGLGCMFPGTPAPKIGIGNQDGC